MIVNDIGYLSLEAPAKIGGGGGHGLSFYFYFWLLLEMKQIRNDRKLYFNLIGISVHVASLLVEHQK